MEIIWRDVKGYEGLYMVNNFGIVKSLEKMWVVPNGGLRKKPETIMKQGLNSSGYYQVWLSKDSKRKNIGIHRLVAIAFLENPLNKTDVNHISGIKTDNRVENLEWATRKENITHAYQNNLAQGLRGSNHNMSVLKEEDVINIRKLSLLYSKKELAEMFGVHRSTIGRIINFKNWTHI